MHTKRARIAAGLIAAGVLVGSIGLARAESDGSTVPNLTGPALVEEMGLEFIGGLPSSGCTWYVDVNGSGGYCLDGSVNSDFEAWGVWHRLAGHVPTELDREVYEIQHEMARTDDPARHAELSRQLEPLLEQQAAQPEWGGPETWEALLEHEGVA